MGKRSGAKANEARKKKRANQTSSKNSETTKKILCTHKPRAVLEKQKQQQRRQQQHTIPAEPVPNENATNEQQQQPNNTNSNTNNDTNEQQQQPNNTNNNTNNDTNEQQQQPNNTNNNTNNAANERQQQPNNTINNTNNGTVEQQPLQHQPHGNNLPPMPNINNNNNGTNPQIASPNRLNFERDDEQQSEGNESGQSDESELGQDDESVELGHNNGSHQLDEAMPEEDETVENDMANPQQQQAQTEGTEMPMEVPDEPCYELSAILAVFTDGKGDRAYFVKWKAYRNYEWVLGTDMFGLEMAVDFTGTSSAMCTMDALEGKPVPKTHLQFLLGNQQFRRLAARLNANPTESERDIMWAYKITTAQKKSAEKQLEPFIRRFMQ
ncbi:hypothetical protein niasHS_004421 [Heterodera schachtii]|uniref:Chromo domain-containing protein n=1 Tax=Heterodera schachtii TaxID=97005 RepID=A0ABD2K1C7_HETSC